MLNRVILPITAALLLSGLFLLFLSYRTVEDRTIEQLNARQAIHAEQAILTIRESFEHDLRFLSSLAGNAHIRELDAQGRDLMDQFFNAHRENISAVTRIGKDGDITYTSPLVQGVIGRNVLHQKHNAPEVFRSDRRVISDVFRAVQGYDAVAVHVPVTHDGVFLGRLSILLPFQTISRRFLTTIRVGETGHAWMVGRDGTILYHPVQAYVGRPAREVFSESPELVAVIDAMTAGASGTAEHLSHGQVMETVYRPIDLGTTLWSLAVSTPRKEALAIIAGFRNQWLLIMAILVATFLLYGYGMARGRRALARRAAELAEANESLQKALAEVKTLSGLLPICVNCHKIRDDSGYWSQVESYVEKHSDAQFSHSLCPECEGKLYGGEDWYRSLKKGKGEREEG
ncbi:MAG TPA: cache domain-containing protein [Deltaproteobacteria bacterium]|nr:cache domain-containing protein [Deltaproteobacteria bacterium]